MRTQALSRLFHVLLTTAAVSACGGAIASVGDGGPEVDGNDDDHDQWDGGRDDYDASELVDAVADHNVGDALADRNVPDVNRPDANRPDANRPDAFSGCAVGSMKPDPALCYATQNGSDPSRGYGNGSDATECKLDCRAVCERAAPGSSTSGGFLSCYWGSSRDGGGAELQYTCGACGVGRIPEDTAPCDRGQTIGDRLAMQAYYEEASVAAFDRLADALQRFGAPAWLVRRARDASFDEQRHTAVFARLAQERGTTAAHPHLDAASPTLFALALENATEGCVRETYGALVAHHQASHAEDHELRAAFASVADDETAHAALSWDLARWFDARLSLAERQQIVAARRQAEQVLRDATSRGYDEADRALGLPSPQVARALFTQLFEALPALDAAA